MITQDRLREVSHYNQSTGIFTRLVATSNACKVGDTMGSLSTDGYVEFHVDSKLYLAHRLAFLYVNGYMPENIVDHKDGNKSNNVWTNIRHATQVCNQQNQKNRSTNTSGFVGVTYRKSDKKWAAQVGFKYKTIPLGLWPTRLDAALARLTWELNTPEWSCNNRRTLVNQISNHWEEFNPKIIG